MLKTVLDSLDEMEQLSKLIFAHENPSSLTTATRTAVAAVLSYLVALLFRLPEAYWAPISTLIALQSELGTALPISIQYFVGTGIGAAVGAVTAAYVGESVWAFGMAVFLVGLLCAVLRIERSAYRYASVTLVIVILITRSASVWLIAIHRFFEVSLGLVIGLLVSEFWPERLSGASEHHARTRL
jgi:uncharacterized membrane protein YgaE (UPF0421/DUF939 family)